MIPIAMTVDTTSEPPLSADVIIHFDDGVDVAGRLSALGAGRAWVKVDTKGSPIEITYGFDFEGVKSRKRKRCTFLSESRSDDCFWAIGDGTYRHLMEDPAVLDDRYLLALRYLVERTVGS